MSDNGWDKAQERSKTGGGGGNYLRLADDGDKFVGAFVGGPHIRELVWNEKKGVYEDFNDEHKALGKKPQPRFSVNVYVPDEKAYRIFEMNNATFKDVIKVKEKYGIEAKFFEVERNGKKGDTKTTYSILPDSDISAEHKKIMEGLKLHDLSKVRDEGDASTDMDSHDKKKTEKTEKPAKEEKPAAAAAAAASAGPAVINPDTSQNIVARLKVLPKEKIDTFLGKFGIKQVKALTTVQLSSALSLLEELEGKPAAAAEEDPFAA